MDPVTKKEIKIHSDDTTSVMVEFEDGTPGQALFSKCMLGHKNDFVVTVSGEEPGNIHGDRSSVTDFGLETEKLEMKLYI